MAPVERVKLPCDLPQPVLREALGTLVSVVPGASLETISADLLVLAVKSGEKDEEWMLPAKVAAFDKEKVSGVLAECVTEAKFKGKTGSSTDMLRLMGGNVKRCVVYGIGKGEKGDVAKAAAFAVSKATGKVGSVALYVEGGVDDFVSAIVEAANVEAYKDTRYKGSQEDDDKDKAPPSELTLVGVDAIPADAVVRGQAIAAGVCTTKELITAPANSLTPEGLADAARLIGKETGIEVQILNREECLKRKMGLYLGVTQGSIREPQFVHMCYKPEGEVKKKIAYVGKAVTFDSGGYNLKTGAGSMIAQMK